MIVGPVLIIVGMFTHSPMEAIALLLIGLFILIRSTTCLRERYAV